MITLGKYDLHEQLGRGGFGTVYRATDTVLGREVALKVLHPQLTTDPAFLARFQSEARTVASLDSPNIVTIYDMGELDGRAYIAMKYLPGGSLADRLQNGGAIPYKEALRIIDQVCGGLSIAHRQYLIHRDIKPSNILFDAEGRAVIGDFGLARAVQASSTSAGSSSGGVGTPAYRAPELWLGKPPASSATDIYSLGCVLSEILTGKILFEGNTTEEVLARHLITGPNMPEEFPEGVPAAVKTLINRAVAKEPNERYQDALEFASDLFSLPVNEKPHQITPPPIVKSRPPVVKEKRVQESPVRKDKDSRSPVKKTSIKFLLLPGILLLGVVVLGLILGWFEKKEKPEANLSVRSDQIVDMTAESPQEIDPTGTRAPTYTPEPTATSVAPSIDTTGLQFLFNEKDQAEIVFIPAGEFLMGSDSENDPYFWGAESPSHTVYLDGYWIYRYEVTNKMYRDCVAAGKCPMPQQTYSRTRDEYYNNPDYDDFPVIYVTYADAASYCKWAGGRLPTEAEWERAARGDKDSRTFPWGNTPASDTQANFCDRGCPAQDSEGNKDDGYRDTSPVGNYLAGMSPYGLFDVAGNVWEWVLDYYSPTYYRLSAEKNPRGPQYTTTRVIKGGGWNNQSLGVRVVQRIGQIPEMGFDTLGFRCAVDAE